MNWILGGDYDNWKTLEPEEEKEPDDEEPDDEEPDDFNERRSEL